jgi:predicted ester cyclase
LPAHDERGDPSAVAQETHKATFKSFRDIVNTGDVELISTMIDETVEPDALIHTPLPMEATGAEALKQVWAILLRGLPDLHLTIEDLVAEGNKLVSRNSVTGTHQCEYMGLPPTGKSITYNEIFILRFSDGRIAETWGVVDVFSQLKQLGVIPA